MLVEIDSEADHLTTQISSLVELSRIEMGALNLKKEWCDVAEIYHGVLPRLKRALANRVLKPSFQANLPLVYVDHAQMGRVFYNLIENAARHSLDQTEIDVIVDRVIDDNVEKVRVLVVDRGTVIPENERESIFVSFNRQPSYGNSLALAICKGIIDAHQGRIWAETADGDGSRFVFTLPMYPYSATHTGEIRSAHSATYDTLYVQD